MHRDPEQRSSWERWSIHQFGCHSVRASLAEWFTNYMWLQSSEKHFMNIIEALKRGYEHSGLPNHDAVVELFSDQPAG